MQWLYVAAGGAVGSVVRYGFGILFNQPLWPVGTWLVNMVGSFLIGILFVLGQEKTSISPEMYLLLATGFMGGFTTFSSFSLEVIQMGLAGRLSSACLYASISLGFGILFTMLGVWIGRYFFSHV